MDMKVFAAVMVLSVVLASAVYAFPGWHGMRGWDGGAPHMRNASSMNWTASQRNWTPANATEYQAFSQAVASGDYQAAESLHSQYGLGGPIFGMLNQTTFAEYSQIVNLQTQLHDLESKLFGELGFQRPPATAGGWMMHGMGPRGGFGHWPRPPPQNSS